MVWFQCEDCGENLKKPKLANHFRGCSAQKLSCIDCGVIFTQQSVQGHTQCVSEAEKYGPKTIGLIKKEIVKTSSKEHNFDGLDVSLGLSTRAPWSCSLCNVKATSQETLLMHSQGKKHKSKVRSMSSKNSTDSSAKEDKATLSSNELGEKNISKSEHENGFVKDVSQLDNRDGQPVSTVHRDQPEKDSTITSKRKKEQTLGTKKKRKSSRDEDRPPSDETGEEKSFVKEGKACFKLAGRKVNGSVEPFEFELSDYDKHMDESLRRKQIKKLAGDDGKKTWSSLIKWKKLIKRALKNAPSGSLRTKQLRSSILPPVMELIKNYGLNVNEASFSRELERQIQSSAKFIIDGKVVKLAR